MTACAVFNPVAASAALFMMLGGLIPLQCMAAHFDLQRLQIKHISLCLKKFELQSKRN